MRLPYRQRLAIIINELGTGLAGRGAELRQAIRNADPALKQTDKVIALLAGQTQTLDRLAVDSDKVLAPLARDRRQVQTSSTARARSATATAEREPTLERNLELLPRVPAPAQADGARAERLHRPGDARPVRPAARGARREPGLRAARAVLAGGRSPPSTSLGQAADVGRTALVKTTPIVERPRGVHEAGPAAGEAPQEHHRVAAGHRRHRAADGLPLLLRGRHQRLRHLRALPAGRPARQRLHELRRRSSRTARRSSPAGRRERGERGVRGERRRRRHGHRREHDVRVRPGAGGRPDRDGARPSRRRDARPPRRRAPARRRRRPRRPPPATGTTASAPAESAEPAAASSLLDYLLGGDK